MPMWTGNGENPQFYGQWTVQDSQNGLCAKILPRQRILSARIPGLLTLKTQGYLPPYIMSIRIYQYNSNGSEIKISAQIKPISYFEPISKHLFWQLLEMILLQMCEQKKHIMTSDKNTPIPVSEFLSDSSFSNLVSAPNFMKWTAHAWVGGVVPLNPTTIMKQGEFSGYRYVGVRHCDWTSVVVDRWWVHERLCSVNSLEILLHSFKILFLFED